MGRWSLRAAVDRSPRLAAAYRAMRDGLDYRAPSRPTPWRFTLAGSEAMASGGFEPIETALIRRLLADVEVFVNVGANVGYYCCHALSLERRVIAFEPLPRNVRYLCRNVAANHFSGIDVFPMAVSDSAGIVPLYGGGTGASMLRGWAGIPPHYVTLVPTTTLDRVIGTGLQGLRSLILVDVEGAELQVLRGATRLLVNAPRPTWLIEVTTTEHQPSGANPTFAETFTTLFDAGYDAQQVDAALTPFSRADVAAVADGSRRPGVHNFLFTPRER